MRSTDFGNLQSVIVLGTLQFLKNVTLSEKHWTAAFLVHCTIFFPPISAHNCGIDVLELLLKGGADLNARTKWGDNALHYAARRGGPEAMRFLVDKGIEIGKTEVRFLIDRSYIN